MGTGMITKKAAYVGAGAGLALFVLIGLLPGSFLGGVFGIKIAGGLFGLPLKPDFLPRFTVGVAMILGVLISGVLFVAGGTLAGWIIGKALDVVKTAGPMRAYFNGRRKAIRAKKSAAATSTKP
jgi:hypothetical protein